MQYQGAMIREIVRHASSLRGTCICIAPSGIGTIMRHDLELLLRDVDILVRLGINVTVIGCEDSDSDAWHALNGHSDVPFLRVKTMHDVVDAAAARNTTKICLVSAADRIMTHRGPLDDIPLHYAEELLSDKHITGECRLVLGLAVRACQAGIPRVHIINVHRYGAILEELFTDRGAGTMLYAGERHKEVRPMQWEDRFTVFELLHGSVKKRTMEFLRDSQSEMHVFTVDKVVHGLARMKLQGDALVVKSLGHSTRMNAADVLENLLRYALEFGNAQYARRVAVLSDEIPALMRIQPWFTKLGFKKGSMDSSGASRDAWIK